MNALVTTTHTTCPYCGVGCGVTATISAGVVAAVAGSAAHPANGGRLCVKGSALHETLGEQGRLLHPRINGARTNWETALDHVAGSLKQIIARHGPDSVAFYLSGQLLTEDYYVANKLLKGFIGSSNLDSNSRLGMAAAQSSYKRAFGSDTMPCSYEDLETCDLLVMVGSNAAWTHPVLFQRIAAAKLNNPQMRVVVIDPRRTATCEIADIHLAIKPGADAFLFAGLLHYLQKKRALNRDYIEAHTEGFDAAIAACGEFDLETSAERTELDIGALEQFYKLFARTQKTVSFYSQGINQSATGTDKCNAIINCHLATGRVGQAGMGPFSITGQSNAMGGREVGALADQLAAHMDYSDDNVALVERFWQSPNIARHPGLKAVDLFDAIAVGKIKAVWIMATNPVVSLPDSERVRAALEQCELVIVSDCIADTDTNAYADVLLPATGWGEKDGSVTNSERCISRQRPLLPALGESKHDWWIICEVAKRLGHTDQFTFENPAQIFAEHAALSGFQNNGSRDFDISGLAGLDTPAYDALAPLQWPVNEQSPQGRTRMFGAGQFFTPNGRAQFITITPSLPAHTALLDTPFQLNTGRIRDQWHSMTRTGRSPRLLAHTGAPFLAINPRDAQSKGIREGDLVQIHAHSTGGRSEALVLQATIEALVLQATIDAGMRDGDVFMPIHWNDQFASDGRVAKLITAITDPISGQPESKFTQVGLKRIKAQRWVALLSRTLIDAKPFSYWVRTPLVGGQLYLLADTSTPTEDNQRHWEDWLSALATGLEKIESSSNESDDYRALLCKDSRIEYAVFASTQRSGIPDTAWLQTLLRHRVNPQSSVLLAHQETSAVNSRRIICSCFQVSEERIRKAIIAGADSAQMLGKQLRCGTNCGSCIPELKQLISQST